MSDERTTSGERAVHAMDALCFVAETGDQTADGLSIVEVNARFAHLFGVERAAARGLPLAELAAEPATLLAAIRDGASGDLLDTVRGIWRHATGHAFSAHFSVASVELPGPAEPAGPRLYCLAIRDPQAPTEVPARLGRRVERTTRQQAALIGLAELTDVEFDQRLRQIVRVDAYTLDVARVGYWSLDDGGRALRCATRFIKSSNSYEGGDELISSSLQRLLAPLAHGAVVSVGANADGAGGEDGALAEELEGALALSDRGVGAVLAVPVHIRGALVGVVLHEHLGASRRWSVDEQLFAMAIAQVCALAIEGHHRQVAEAALRESEARFRAIVDAAPVPMLVTTRERGRLLLANEAASAALGLTREELLELGAEAIYAEPAERELLLRRLAVQGHIRDHEMELRRSDGGRWGGEGDTGDTFWANVSIQPVTLAEQQALVVGFADITERRRMEQTLRHMALHDTLTGLPNRAMFYDLLRREMARAGRNTRRGFAVLFIDLDDFKAVNDSFGHEAGDTLLVSIASRLRSCLRPHDAVGRLGGDEFAVLLTEITHSAEAVTIAERITAVVRVPHHFAGAEATPSVSIGVVLNAERYDDPDRMLRDADQAMYRAKALGKSRYQIFSPEPRRRKDPPAGAD